MPAVRCVARLLAIFVLLLTAGFAEEPLRPKDVRALAKQGSTAIPQLQELLKNPDLEIRVEAVKAMVEIGGKDSLTPLIQATADNDAEVQIRAAEGLVNFYLPGYVRTGLSASLRRVGTSIKAKFTDVNDQVIDSFVEVRPDVIAALGRQAHAGSSIESRASAARAVGILRGRGAVDDLIAAIRTKNSEVIYEALVALQKIRDQSAAPKIAFLLHDLDEKVQIAAIETTGLLQNKDSIPDLMDAIRRARNNKVRRAALTAIAMLPAEGNREIYARYLNDKDEGMRAAAAEGYARLRNPADLAAIETVYKDEEKRAPRLAQAFALVMLGQHELSEFSPLQLLINTLNSAAYHGVAGPYLVEAARDPAVRALLYQGLPNATKDEKIQLAGVLARSGDQESVPYLEKLSHDADDQVAQEGLRALRALRARL
ncbi:MAG: HEAT repeat domain-containing protein [Candidatus Solibacter usitatus]|nr:HEAT repeat domain-containing protein [Candidatus Solibacter usitatus]